MKVKALKETEREFVLILVDFIAKLGRGADPEVVGECGLKCVLIEVNDRQN